jgi:hypothetical protein
MFNFQKQLFLVAESQGQFDKYKLSGRHSRYKTVKENCKGR